MREAEIRPANLLGEYLRLSAADAETFFSDKSGLVERACPGCGDIAPRHLYDKNGFAIVVCEACETLYANPAPAADRLARFYADSPSTRYWANVFFPAVAETRRTKIFRPRAERILDLAARLGRVPRRVIDVGAGAGLLLEEIGRLSADTECAAVEPGEILAARLCDKGIATFPGFAEDAAEDANWAGSADLVTCSEVIEHIGDTVSFVAALGRLARPGGIVIITGLCGDGFDIRLLGAHSNAVCPPHHITFLSRRGVAALLARCGLDEIDFLTPGELDVDIVMNALDDDPNAVTDPRWRDRLLSASAADRSRLQAEIAASLHSSHMWIVARRPNEARG